MCQLCTITVIAGLGISRALGVDDSLISVWIGGLILSLSFWFINWAEKRKWYQKLSSNFKQIVTAGTFVLMYAFVTVPLILNHSIGINGNTLLGIDKIVFGIITGSLVFLGGVWADKKVRKVLGRQLFQFQKVVFPALALSITSLIFYFLTK